MRYVAKDGDTVWPAAVAQFEFADDDPLRCPACARRLRKRLQRVSGIEAIGISVARQRISIGYNTVLLDADDLGEKLAELGHVVRPARKARYIVTSGITSHCIDGVTPSSQSPSDTRSIDSA
jgi:copper chaperone CopZ